MKSLDVISHSKYLILKSDLSILWLLFLAENSNFCALCIVMIVVKIRVSVEGTQSEPLIDYIVDVTHLFNQAATELLN